MLSSNATNAATPGEEGVLGESSFPASPFFDSFLSNPCSFPTCIFVAVRMRPLNSREQTTENNRVWHVLLKYNCIAQCTSSGRPLPERIENRTFFSIDKTFEESSTTRQVYEQTCRGIVESVASGFNGTVLAYGQTSSGKIFTMQGSGTLQDGILSGRGDSVLDNGGIIHMAASDLFAHIEKDPERVFLVRVSFI
jgi:centromeric protein E